MSNVDRLEIFGPYTTAERDALFLNINPQPYYMIFNSDTAQFEFWDGSGWQTVPSNGPTFEFVEIMSALTVRGSSNLGDSGADITTITGFLESTKMAGVLLEKQGDDTVAANDLDLGGGGNPDANAFEITGATQINAIKTTGWQNGALLTLLFASTPTVKHNTAGGAGTSPILFSGAVDFVASAGDTLTLRLTEIGGVQAWREISRAVI